MKRFRLPIILATAIACVMIAIVNVHGADSAAGMDVIISRLVFDDAEISQVMKTLSEIGDRNIILDKDITGQMTLYLSDVSWKEAFLAVLKMNDLVAYEDNGLLKVISRTIYNERRNSVLTAQKQQKVESKLEEPVNVHVMKIFNARAEDIKATIDPLLGEQDQPAVDVRTNSLVFAVSDSSLTVIEEMIKELDTETRQVSIEVKMVTVDAGSLSELGVNWSAVKNGNSIEQTTVGEESKLLLATWAGKATDATLGAAIATLIDKNMAEVVSRPHVTTQDNEPATISSGQRIPIITYDEARNSVVTMEDATTQLVVTPHTLSDDRILMEISATRRSAEGVGAGLKINEELAEVTMIVSNNETAVIGGMRQMQETKLDSGIPILQDIPLLGQLFKYTKRENKRTDLIIFITPHVVQNVEPQITQKLENTTN